MAEWTKAEQQLQTWLCRACDARDGHRVAAKYYARFHWVIGSLVVLLSAGTGTALAASLQETNWGRWGMAMMPAIVAVLAALQTFRQFDKTAQRHEAARAGFSCVCRDIEQVLALDESQRQAPDLVLTRLRARLDDLANLPVSIPERLWQKGRKEKATKHSGS